MSAQEIRANSFLNGKLHAGRLVFGDSSLRFTSDVDRSVVELPLAGLVVRFGGHNDTQIFFEHPAHPGIGVNTSSRAALDHPFFSSPPYAAQLRAYDKNLKRTPPMVYGFAVIGLLIVAAVLALFLLKNRMARWATSKIPAQWEQKLGDQVIRSVEARQPFLTDEKYLSQLASITNRLIPVAGADGYSFKFYIVQDTNINAFAIPGGHVVIHTALMDAASSKEEIAGVLAHEMAHVTERHSMRKIVESAGLFLLLQAVIGDTEGLVKLLTDSSSTLLQQKFSRDFEREADDKGWEFLLQAKIDPRGMTAFFSRLLEEEKKRGAGGMTGPIGLLSTHPPTTERIKRLEDKWNQVEDKESFEPL